MTIMASASPKSDKGILYSHQDILLPPEIPQDAVLSVFTIKNDKRTKKPPIDTERRKAITKFYGALRGDKYRLPEGLPIAGMVVAVFNEFAYRPAMVTRDVFWGEKSKQFLCDVVYTDTNQTEFSVRLDQVRLVARQFMDLLPWDLVEDKDCLRRILRVKRHSSSDEEVIDYESFLPLDQIIMGDYEFPHEPLMKTALEKKQESKEKPTGDPRAELFKAATFKVKLTHVTSPTEFIFVDQEREKAYAALCERMNEIYSADDTDPFFIPKVLVVQNMPVVALKPMTGWLRGYVKAIIDDDIVEICPVDGSGFCQVLKKDLRFLAKELASTPAFGFHGRLGGIKPKYRNWIDSETDAFKDMVVPAGNSQYIVGVVKYFTPDGVAALHLWNKNKRGDGFWLVEELVRRGLAVNEPNPVNASTSSKDPQVTLLADLFKATKCGESTSVQ